MDIEKERRALSALMDANARDAIRVHDERQKLVLEYRALELREKEFRDKVLPNRTPTGICK